MKFNLGKGLTRDFSFVTLGEPLREKMVPKE